MRIFVTGGAGFVGAHLLSDLLSAGHEVTALVRTPHRLGPLRERVHVVHGDLTTVNLDAAMTGHDACIHAALFWEDERQMHDLIVGLRVFETAARVGARRVVYLSSTAVHRPFSASMRETDVLSTTDLYGATKASSELFLAATCAQTGLEGAVLRVAPVVGPPAFSGAAHRSDTRIAALVSAVARGEPLTITAGDGRQLIGAVDLAHACRLAVEASTFRTRLCAESNMTSWEDVARIAVSEAHSLSSIDVIEPAVSAPRFDVSRLANDLGLAFDAKAALREHIRHLLAAT